MFVFELSYKYDMSPPTNMTWSFIEIWHICSKAHVIFVGGLKHKVVFEMSNILSYHMSLRFEFRVEMSNILSYHMSLRSEFRVEMSNMELRT